MSSDAGSIPAASRINPQKRQHLQKELVSRKKRSALLAGFILFFLLSGIFFSQAQPFIKLSVKDYPTLSRVIVDSSFPLSFDIEKSSSLLMVTVRTDVPFRIQREAFESRIIKSFGWSKGKDFYILAIRTKVSNFSYDYFTLSDPPKLVIDFTQVDEEKDETEDSLKEKEAIKEKAPQSSTTSPSSSRRTASSALQGMKTIVIDPGHGGLEPGARGRFGTLEKNVALEIALKLKAVIERNFPCRVVLTRDKDLDVSLENRAAIANNNKADVFISIHANSSYRKEARGSETYFLSRDATDEEARRLAFMENNPAEPGEGISGENGNEIQMILWDMAQSAYLKQSSLLAESIQKELNLLLRTSNRGVKQAPFTVLAGVACPAVLVEVAFISNPREERSLTREGFQVNVAEAIYRGLVNYIEPDSQK
jgi:N-acetylmuramoyl-L-alanine amidase